MKKTSHCIASDRKSPGPGISFDPQSGAFCFFLFLYERQGEGRREGFALFAVGAEGGDGDAVFGARQVAEGDGPVDALDAALRRALDDVFPQLKTMSLVDYKVRVLNSEAATAARVRVIIESKDADEVWGTVGVDENVIEASWIALCDSIEYKLAKCQASPAQP